MEFFLYIRGAKSQKKRGRVQSLMSLAIKMPNEEKTLSTKTQSHDTE